MVSEPAVKLVILYPATEEESVEYAKPGPADNEY
jgi:hypothetical protein